MCSHALLGDAGNIGGQLLKWCLHWAMVHAVLGVKHQLRVCSHQRNLQTPSPAAQGTTSILLYT